MNHRHAALSLLAVAVVGILDPRLVEAAQSQSEKSTKLKPTGIPTSVPTVLPTDRPSLSPTNQPSRQPVSSKKTGRRTNLPTPAATASGRSTSTSDQLTPPPSMSKGTSEPDESTSQTTALPEETSVPSVLRTRSPAPRATGEPSSIAPTSLSPTSVAPTDPPTHFPTYHPTALPTEGPSREPSIAPTPAPTVSPTSQPTLGPTPSPTTMAPTILPTTLPSTKPSAVLSSLPSEIPSDSPSHVPTTAPSRPPIDFGPRAFRRPDDPIIVRITNVEVSFRGIPLEALAIADRRKLEAVTTEWYNDFYSTRDLPHLQWDVQLSLQKLDEDALQLLFEISLGSRDMDLVAQPDPSVYLWMPWEDQEANEDYVERVVTAMPETFAGLETPMDVPRILTPTVLLPADKDKNTKGNLSIATVRVGLGVVAGVFVCMCTVAAVVLLTKAVRPNRQSRPSGASTGAVGSNRGKA